MLLTNDDKLQRMPKIRQLPWCFLNNNIRYLILTLLIACCSLLFANVLLYSVAVLCDDFQGTQLWRQMQWKQFSTTKTRRFLRSTVDGNKFNSSILPTELAGAVMGTLSTHLNESFATYGANNSSHVSRNLYAGSDVIEGEKETTTVKLLSEFDLPVRNKKEHEEEPTYKSNLDRSKDDVRTLKWNDFTKVSEVDKSENPAVQIKDVIQKTMEERIQHFLVWTAPGIGMICGCFCASWFLPSFGGRRYFALMMIISAIATALLAMVPHVKHGRYLTASIRSVQGITVASIFPMIGMVTANWGTLNQQFFFLVCCTFFIQIAPLISWSVSVAIFTLNYRTPFWVHAALTFILAVIWLVAFREKPQYHSLVNGLELNKIVTGKIKVKHNRIMAENPHKLLITSFPVWAIWIAAFGYFFVISVVVQFLPLYCLLIARKTPANSSHLAALPFLFMLFFTLLHGVWHRMAKFCDERTSVLTLNTTSFVICSLIFIFLAIFPPGGLLSYSIVTPLTMILCILTFSLYGFYRSATLTGRFFGQFIISYIQMFVGLAFFISAAAVVFFITEFTADEWRIVFLLSACLLLISAVVFGVFGSAEPEEWSKDSWNPSAALPMITLDQIDYQTDECGVLEMKILR